MFRVRYATILSTAATFVSAFLLAGEASAAKTPPRPNVVFILADDLGWSDLGCYGGEIETPNVDRLAAGGLRFTQFYNTARCWPSRAALLTGYYAQQVNRDPSGNRPPWAALTPQLLEPAGYRSYHSGKWHVDGPVLAGGFLRSFNTTDQNRFFSPRTLEVDDQKIEVPSPGDNYYATTAIADHAIEWLADHDKAHAAEPFFLYLAFISPHFPLQAPAEDIARYRDRYVDGWDKARAARWKRIEKLGLVSGSLSEPEPDVVPSWNLSADELREQVGAGEEAYAVPWNTLSDEQKHFQSQKMAVHAAMVDRMDREIGRVLRQLDKMDVSDNTLVFFASDNGASAEQIIRGDGHDPTAPIGSAKTFLGLGPGWSTMSNTPMRRHKSWNHEGGIATPLVVCWPKGIAGRGELRHAPGHFVDIMPTLIELAGVEPPSSFNGAERPKWPGTSLVPCFASDVRPPHEPFFFKHQHNRGLRAGDLKIVAAGDDSPWELYDLARDR
ncbi:MAG TPA: arylsulfatase, partial [Pirellulales bacterium]|nr:arylsulfatase [Pirellulales bacterium]